MDGRGLRSLASGSEAMGAKPCSTGAGGRLLVPAKKTRCQALEAGPKIKTRAWVALWVTCAWGPRRESHGSHRNFATGRRGLLRRLLAPLWRILSSRFDVCAAPLPRRGRKLLEQGIAATFPNGHFLR